MKTCNICQQEKPVTDFYTAKVSKDGYRNSCKACDIARQSKYQKTPEGRAVHRKAILKHRYGISIKDYDDMLERQGGGCGICGAATPGNAGKEFFSVDHDHETGRVRGLLCLRCNNSLGWMETWQEQVTKYLS